MQSIQYKEIRLLLYLISFMLQLITFLLDSIISLKTQSLRTLIIKL